jgi:hypothetical protein
MYIGLVDMKPMQLEWAQMDVICSRYRDMFIFPYRKKMMTVQSIQFVQCHVAADMVGIVGADVESSRGDTWKGD